MEADIPRGRSGEIPTSKQERPRYCSWMRGHKCVFYVVLILLVLGFFLCGAVLILSGRRLNSALQKKGAAQDAALLGKVSSAISLEPVFLQRGTPCSTACRQLDYLLNEVERKEHRYGLDISALRSAITKGREGYARGLQGLEIFEQYTKASLLVFTALRLSLVKQTDRGFAAQMGLSCIIDEVRPLYEHYTLLAKFILPEWSVGSYQLFLGTEYNDFEYPECTPYLDQLKMFDYISFIKEGPELVAPPTLSFDDVTTELDVEALEASMVWLQNHSEDVGSSIAAYWGDRVSKLVTVAITMSVSALLLLITAILLPLCVEPPNIPSEADVTREYTQMEARSKLLPQYAHYIMTLKQDGHLYNFSGDAVLRKIIGFISRARPCVQQTCFGDVETVTYNGNGEIVLTRGDDAAIAATEDEQRSQELRTDLGLHLVCGTYLCVAVGVAYGDSVTSKGAPKLTNMDDYVSSVSSRMYEVIKEVERIVTSKRGVLHTVTGDYIFATWNVASSSSTSELNALASAFELQDVFSTRGRSLSMSISRSTAVAGNAEAAGQRTAVICGSGIARCEQLELLNSYHGTSIMLDHEVATKLSSVGISGFDFCVVPVSLYELFRPPIRSSEQEERPLEIAYAVYPVRMQERLKAWTTMFRDLPQLLKAEKVTEMLERIVEYRNTYNTQTDSKAHRKGASQVDNSKTVDFWIMSLNRYMERGMEDAKLYLL